MAEHHSVLVAAGVDKLRIQKAATWTNLVHQLVVLGRAMVCTGNDAMLRRTETNAPVHVFVRLQKGVQCTGDLGLGRTALQSHFVVVRGSARQPELKL